MHYKNQIAVLLSDAPSREVIESIILESHRLAQALLRKRVRHGQLSTSFFDLSIEDLALDCIADLFERDARGRFPQLRSYFTSVSWQKLDEAGLHIALRRLIFSQVNDGLFRRYRQADPNLSKIIRNLKIAARSNPDGALISRNGQTWLIADPDGRLNGRPLAPPELVDIHLTSFIEGTVEMPTILAGMIACFREWPHYANGYPLVQLAKAVRSSLIRLQAVEQHRETATDRALLSDEVQRAIAWAVEKVKADLHATYVANKKVDAATFDHYFRAVQDVIQHEYVAETGSATSYHEALQRYLPDLSMAAYRREHRNKFEYIAKKCRSELVNALSTEWT